MMTCTLPTSNPTVCIILASIITATTSQWLEYPLVWTLFHLGWTIRYRRVVSVCNQPHLYKTILYCLTTSFVYWLPPKREMLLAFHDPPLMRRSFLVAWLSMAHISSSRICITSNISSSVFVPTHQSPVATLPSGIQTHLDHKFQRESPVEG